MRLIDRSTLSFRGWPAELIPKYLRPAAYVPTRSGHRYPVWDLEAVIQAESVVNITRPVLEFRPAIQPPRPMPPARRSWRPPHRKVA
ncbi:hypothetical protein ASF30_01945 [Leifsonia sp. Leaf264]|nr:hypothetical protein ASF30_01945 [Leifsonia sp. Leaf264]